MSDSRPPRRLGARRGPFLRGFSALALTGALALAAAFVATTSAASRSRAAGLGQIQRDAFVVRVTDAVVAAGEPGAFQITIVAKAPYKVNADYPHKVKLSEPPAGVSVPKRLLRRSDGRFEGSKKLTFSVPVQAERAGQYDLGGVVKFSVCSDERCLLEKRVFTARVSAE